MRPEPAEIVQIPIRPGMVIRIAHIPFDLTPAEADKIVRVIRAYAGQQSRTGKP